MRFESCTLSYEEQVMNSNLRVIDSNLISRMKLKAKGDIKGFESLSYGFKSLIGVKFKFSKGDSNPPKMDSNLPFYRSIKCATCNSNNTKFQKQSLSQRLVNASNDH